MTASVPPPSDRGTYRHLGAGGGPSHRVQLSLVLVALLVLIAVPLYLLRRPSKLPGTTDAGMGGPRLAVADAGGTDAMVAPVLDAGGHATGITLGDLRTIRCANGVRGKASADRCDPIPFVQDALLKAIRENGACAPPTTSGGSVNFVLSTDFARKRYHLRAGRSGTLKRKAAGELVRCVLRALPQPPWGTIAHQFVRYEISVMASYPPGSGTP